MGMFDDIFNKLREIRQQQGQQGNLFGGSESGQKASGLVPDYLKGATGGGTGMGDFFAQAFQQLQDPRALNRQLGLIGQSVAGRERKMRTAGKFKGSPIGEALAQGVAQGGQSLEQQARLQDQAQKMRSGLALSQGFTGAVTNPLLSILGISMGDEQARAALAEQARQFNKSQPSTIDKILGTVGGILCWTAREVLKDDRWLDAREYLIKEASPVTLGLYEQHGQELAAKVRKDPDLRKRLKPVFVEFARRGRKYRGW